MKSSCLVKSLLIAAAAAWSAHADILPPDSHLVPRTVTLVNTGDYPGLVFAALEFYPGQTAPIAVTQMGPGIEAKLTGYKLDFIRIYAAKAADWPGLKGKLGLAKASSGAGVAAACVAPAAVSPGTACVCCHDTSGTAPDPAWDAGLTLVAGDVAANSQYAPNSSTLKSEAYEYKLEGENAGKLTLFASLQTYADGSKKEVLQTITALRPIAPSAPAVRMAADGRSLVWVPRHNGVAAVSLSDAEGRRAWSIRRMAISGEAQSIALPAMSAGRYLLSAQGRGWAQSAWLDLGRR